MQIITLFGGAQVKVDDADAAFLRRWAWQIQGKGSLQYARRSTGPGGCTTIYMHRAIMVPPKAMVVDHIDGDGLNNQRSNLRVVTAGQNLWNRRVKAEGVSWRKQNGKWRATIDHEKKKYEVGFYERREDAVTARAYVASVIRKGIAPDAAEIDRLQLRPTIRRLMFSMSA